MEKWREEEKAKEQALAQVEEEQRSKEATETFRDIKTISKDWNKSSRLNKDSSTDASLLSNNISQTKGEEVSKLLEELDRLDGLYEKEESYDRECLICMKDEVSVVFLPCAHQVVCVSCSESFMGGDKATCPCCRVPVQQRIRVFGATS
ncbi:hypothetical protein Bca52824_009455 [Brassica carinata]|uniref:RING-type domain-containing protein n=1 Tax=Brassica carinata TaxID=52824 RepID=A0A8X8BA96_BRACI|nr:hypothetical protein Bca52824_009455 [Brassica carinata]